MMKLALLMISVHVTERKVNIVSNMIMKQIPATVLQEYFGDIKNFTGTKCKWQGCMEYGEYNHCVHSYCWKHGKYGFNQYTKCQDCKKELGIKGDQYWEELVLTCAIQVEKNRQGFGVVAKGFLPLQYKEEKEWK